MARGERGAGWEEAGDGAGQGTGGFALSRRQARCQRGGCGRGWGRGSHTPDIYTPDVYTHKYIYLPDIYTS